MKPAAMLEVALWQDAKDKKWRLAAGEGELEDCQQT